MRLRTAILALAIVSLQAQAAPLAPDKDLAWLPVSGELASVRLAPDADLRTLAPLLEGGYRLASAPIWRVPSRQVSALRAHPDVVQIWGMPRPESPPDDADLPPTTPDFAADQAWRTQMGVDRAGWWPGGLGQGVRVVDIEYDVDPTHEDLTNNPPLDLGGEALGEYYGHGNACMGLVGASDDGFGTTGGAPLAELAFVRPIDDETYDVARAVELAITQLQPGDVILIEQQVGTPLGLGPTTVEPGTWEAVRAAVEAGIHVVEPVGNGAVDLDDPIFSGWFSADNDPGVIRVGAVAAGTSRWNGRSSYGGQVHLFGDGGGLAAPSHPDSRTDAFFPDDDPRQAYTGRFGGTSGAAATVAGVVASVSGVARELRGITVPPRQLRGWLVQTGSPQDITSAAEHPVGARPSAERAVQAWLSF